MGGRFRILFLGMCILYHVTFDQRALSAEMSSKMNSAVIKLIDDKALVENVSVLKKEIHTLLSKEARQLSDFIYQGKWVGNTQQELTVSLKTVACSPIPTVLNECKKEWTQNFQGTSCPSQSYVGLVQGPSEGSNLVQVTSSYHPHKPSLEQSHRLGALVSSISHHYRQLSNEIEAGQITVENTSECFIYAQKLNESQNRMLLLKNKEEIQNCKARKITDCQAAKQFEGMMKSYNGAVTQLLRCVLVERASKDYADYDLVALEPIQMAQKNCAARVTESGSLRACYKNEYEKLIIEELRKKWPLAHEGC